MKLSVKVKPRAKEDRVEVNKDEIRIFVKEPPEKGKANKAVIKLLAKHFKVPQASIKIISGKTSRNKIVIL